MSGALQPVDGDPAIRRERCVVCGSEAAGPCASCKKMVCGDCSVLTEGGVDTWAICVRCDRKKGRSLAPGWNAITISLILFVAALGTVALAIVLLSRP